MIKDEIDVIQEIVEGMDIDLKALKIVVNGGAWDVTVCNVLHLNVCSKVVFDDITYQVTNVDESFELFTMANLSGGVGDPVLSFENGVKTIITPALNFMYGTYSEVNQEIKIKDKCDTMTYPIVFMLEEPLRGDDFGYKSVFEKEITCKLFFLQSSSNKDWDKNDHRHNATKGMQQLAINMHGYINKKKVLYNYMDEMELVRLPEFSVYTSGQGKKATILDDKVSGYGASFTLVTRKTNGCCKDLK